MDAEQKKNIEDKAVQEGTTPERIQKHGERPVVHTNQPASERLVDGYAQTEGADYAQPRRDEVDDYDPAHSGVRHAQNKPGAPTSAPGRDEGTAWSEQKENGRTDIPERKNPAD